MPNLTSSSNELDILPTVFVVDDDRSFIELLSDILAAVRVEVKGYHKPSDFIDDFSSAPPEVGCIILDVRLPEMSGLELHKKLVDDGVQLPVIIITAYGEVADAVQALKAGAIDYIQKPASPQAMLERIQRAILVSLDRHQDSKQLSQIHTCYLSLSPREEQVLDLLLDGKSTKQVSATLGIGLTTVDYHRNNVLQKMQVENVVELTQLMSRYHHLRSAMDP